MSTARLAGLVVGALLAFTGFAHSAVVPFTGAIEPDTRGHEVSSIVKADSRKVARAREFEFVVEPAWADAAFPATFFTTPASPATGEWLLGDPGVSPASANAAGSLGWWQHRSAPVFNESPFYNSLVRAGEYVLDVGTLSNEAQASTKASAVPLPGAIWLFGSALMAFVWISGRHRL